MKRMFFFLLLCGVASSSLEARLTLGSRDSMLWVQDGELVVTQDLVINTGEVNIGSSATLGYSDGATLTIGTGSLYQDNQLVLTYTADTTLYADVFLAQVLSCDIAALGASAESPGAITISGNGQRIVFAGNNEPQITIGAYTTVTFSGVELVNFSPGNFVFSGDGCAVTLDNSSLSISDLAYQYPINYPITFTGDCFVKGDNNLFTFGEDGSFSVPDSSDNQLIIQNLRLWNFGGSPLSVDGAGTITLCDCICTLASGWDGWTFAAGHLQILGKVTVNGPEEFTYSSPAGLVIQANSSLEFNNTRFYYQSSAPITGYTVPPISSYIYLNETQFLVGTSGVTEVKLYAIELASNGLSTLTANASVDGVWTALTFGNHVAESHNSILRVETGTLSTTNIVINMKDAVVS